jgi:hypothetical protein
MEDNNQIKPQHWEPLLLAIPTETIYFDENQQKQALVMEVGIEFNLVPLNNPAFDKEDKRSYGAAPSPRYAINLITGENLEFEEFAQFCGEGRMVDLLDMILWQAEEDEDFDVEHKEYLYDYVKPLMDVIKD